MPERSYYCTDVLGVSAGVVDIVMMAARIVDAFTDITMGQIADRRKPTRDGKFRPWLNLYNVKTQKKQIEFQEFNLLGGCGGRI